jgi:hypothetical protein
MHTNPNKLWVMAALVLLNSMVVKVMILESGLQCNTLHVSLATVTTASVST